MTERIRIYEHGATQIAIIERRPRVACKHRHLDIRGLLGEGSRPHAISLLARIHYDDPRVFIEDLAGTGVHTGLRSLGWGTLLMNTLINFLRESRLPPRTRLFAPLPVDDGDLAYRYAFFTRFGLHQDPRHLRPMLTGFLQYARTIPGHAIYQETLVPREIPLSTFKDVDHWHTPSCVWRVAPRVAPVARLAPPTSSSPASV